MRHYKYLIFFTLLFLLITSLGIFLEVRTSLLFVQKESYTPRLNIAKDLNQLKKVRLIQLLNWPIIKDQLVKKYPMINELQLSLSTYPNLKIIITEKKPWAIIINDNQQKIFSYDGTLLNPELPDVELPSNNIIIVNSETQLTKGNQIAAQYLSDLQQISDGLKIIPFFELQQISIFNDNTELISKSGIRVNLGKVVNTIEKFEMLKYFISNQRKELGGIELIDIQFPKRVIIK